jgi:hypothetical protein
VPITPLPPGLRFTRLMITVIILVVVGGPTLAFALSSLPAQLWSGGVEFAAAVRALW